YVAVAFEDQLHEPAQRAIRDRGVNQSSKRGEAFIAVVARALDQRQGIEAIRSIGVVDRANLLEFDLLAILFVLEIDAAELVAAPDFPGRRTIFVEGAIGPD